MSHWFQNEDGDDVRSEVAVVGAGLGGAAAAAVLSRAGCDVIVVDRHSTYPADFRAEQLVGWQTDALHRLGLLDGIVGQSAPAPSATATCFGKVIDETFSPHYGLRYEDMVNAARAQASGARFVTGRVARVTTGPDMQHVVLADGAVIQARLVVLATGPNCGDLLPQLGIERHTLSEHHSLTLGFDVQTSSRRVLVCYGEQAGDGMGYLTVFPIGDTMRANLFCYRAPGDPWVKEFKRDPKRALLDVMPSLERLLGPFEIAGKVQVRPNSIHRAENVRRQAGIVLIGDAFQSSCPAVGKGVGRILADLEVLRRVVPAWLGTPGMDADKIEQFYQDPAKCRFDAEALRAAEYRRALSTQTSWTWKAHRAKHYCKRRTLGVIARALRHRASSGPGPRRSPGSGTDGMVERPTFRWGDAKRAAIAIWTSWMLD